MFEGLKSTFEKVREFISRKVKGEREENVKRISKGEIEEPSETLKKMDRAKGNAEADAALWKEKYNKLKNAVEKKEKVNVGKKLQEEQKELSESKFEGAISFRKLLDFLKKNEVTTVSAHGEKEFGPWRDIALLSNGQLAWIVKNNGENKPVITGRTMWNMLRDHKNPKKTISKGIVHVNLDESGNYVENLDAERVPNIIKDANGNFVQTRVHKDEVMKIIAEKEKKLRNLQSYVAGLEKSFLEENEEKTTIDRMRNLQKKRSDVSESELSDELERTKQIIEDDRLKDEAVAESFNALKIEREMEKELYGKRQELFNKVSNWFPEDEEERVKGKTKNLLSWLQSNIMEPSVTKQLEAKEEKEKEGSEGGEGL